MSDDDNPGGWYEYPEPPDEHVADVSSDDSDGQGDLSRPGYVVPDRPFPWRTGTARRAESSDRSAGAPLGNVGPSGRIGGNGPTVPSELRERLNNIRGIRGPGRARKGRTQLGAVDWEDADLAEEINGADLATRQKLVIEHRLRQGRRVVPMFSEARFLSSVKSARISVGGDLEITLAIPASEKYAAMPLTDASGILVLIHAERRRRHVYDLDPEITHPSTDDPVRPGVGLPPVSDNGQAGADVHDQRPPDLDGAS